MKTVYLYNNEGIFIGEYIAQESPLEEGVFIKPTLSTETEPPAFAEKEIPVFFDSVWTISDDFRGDVWFDKVTGHPVEINFIGTPSDELSATPIEIIDNLIKPLTMRQARLALLKAGLLDEVNLAITTDEQKIWWDYSSVVERNHPLVDAVLTALGKTKAEIDAMFIAAATL